MPTVFTAQCDGRRRIVILRDQQAWATGNDPKTSGIQHFDLRPPVPRLHFGSSPRAHRSPDPGQAPTLTTKQSPVGWTPSEVPGSVA